MPVLFLTVLIDLIGFGIIIPILPFMAPELGASAFDIALIIAIYSVFAGFAGPLWGRLSDRIGRKPVLLVCLGGSIAGYVMLALSTELWMVYAARIFAGCMAGNFGVASAMIADMTPASDRARAMGKIGAAFGIGMVIGPFLGGVLAGPEGAYHRAFWLAAALSLVALAAGWLLLHESLSASERDAHRDAHRRGDAPSMLAMLRSTGNTLLACQYLLHTACISAATYLFPLWVGAVLGWSPREVGIVFGIQGLTMAISQFALIGPLIRIFGELRLLALAVGLVVSGFLLAMLADGPVTMVLAFFVLASGGTFCMPILNALTARRTPLTLRGRMLGTTSAMASWGRVAGPLLAGGILSLFGFAPAWLFGALVAMLYLAWVIGEVRRAGS